MSAFIRQFHRWVSILFTLTVIANFAAGVEVGKLGAATVSATEVVSAFDEMRVSR